MKLQYLLIAGIGVLVAIILGITVSEDTTQQTQVIVESVPDPLPSWNSGDSKQKIVEFVNQVTDSSSSSFVPIMDRIATFDNDGTLWIEQPLYIPFAFHLEYLYEQLEDNPSLFSQSPYTEILAKGDTITNKDLEHIPGLTDILIPAYPGITQEEYLQKSKNYLDNTNHSKYNVAFKELTYHPMVELVHYLQQNDFQVYIVSAGFQGMMRAVSEEIYNIEKENVIGTHPEFISQLTEKGPGSTVGRPADALETIVSKNKLDGIIMIDAALKMEGEDSASVAQGFGAAIGGIGVERFQIEAIATNNKIPVFSIVVKQSVKEAIGLMTKEIADQADDVRLQVYEMIQENTKHGQSVLIIGVGNTVGVSQ